MRAAVNDKEASQTRDCCVAKSAAHRAARPDPSRRKERLFRMTSVPTGRLALECWVPAVKIFAERSGDANDGAMVASVVYGARHSAGGCDHLRSAGDDPGDAGGADAGGTGGGGGGVLPGANWRTGYAELAGKPFAALCGVCSDCGVSVGDPAHVVGCGAAGQLFARLGDGRGFV